MPVRPDPRSARPRGLALIALVMVLLLGAHLAWLGALLAGGVQQQAARAHLHSLQARTAAEAGLAWAQAALNATGALDARCEPASPAQGGRILRTRWMASSDSPSALRPACRRAGSRWACDCPDQGEGQPGPGTSDLNEPAFGMRLEAQDRSRGLWQLTVDGCSQPGPDCGAPQGPEPAARHRLQVSLARAGGGLQAPQAALSAVGSVALAGDAEVARTDPAGAGPAVQAGSAITVATPARTLGPPGTPAEAARRGGDVRLAEGAEPVWPRLAGLPAARLPGMPGWTRLDCRSGGCPGTVLEALRAGHRLLWIEGDLQLDGQAWGTPQDPVLLAVRGRLQANDTFSAHGLLIGDTVRLGPIGTGGRSRVQGAVLSLGEARIEGPIDLRHDAALLARLTELAGTLLMVPGSWIDPPRR
ncbi:MAG: hypothetical protein RLZZ592_214 [Pseudomonadota bacterium]